LITSGYGSATMTEPKEKSIYRTSAGRGVFEAWNDRTFFEAVRLGSHGATGWGADIDICPDAIYLQLTGKSPAGVLPALRSAPADA